MMKNTLITNAEDMICLYREAMMDFLNDTQGDNNFSEFAEDLIRLGRTIIKLSSKDPSVALDAFRTELGCGNTMMMFRSNQFDQLEVWSKANEDFRVVIFREDGSPVGIVEKKDINW
jgi:hypothetical protein